MPRLDGVSAAELGRFFPEPSITAHLLPLLQESGIDGFNLRSIMVLRDNTPILLLPLDNLQYFSHIVIQTIQQGDIDMSVVRPTAYRF